MTFRPELFGRAKIVPTKMAPMRIFPNAELMKANSAIPFFSDIMGEYEQEASFNKSGFACFISLAIVTRKYRIFQLARLGLPSVGQGPRAGAV